MQCLVCHVPDSVDEGLLGMVDAGCWGLFRTASDSDAGAHASPGAEVSRRRGLHCETGSNGLLSVGGCVGTREEASEQGEDGVKRAQGPLDG